MKIDTHIHSLASRDGSMTAETILALAKRAGLDAIAITDHNSTAAFSGLPGWDAQGGNAQQVSGVLLIRGCEFSTEVGHIAALFVPQGIERTLPSANRQYRAADVLDAVHKAGGLCVWAHPCKGPYRGRTRELLEKMPDTAEAPSKPAMSFDLLEGYNGRAAVTRKGDLNAMFEAERNAAPTAPLPLLAASDAHRPAEVGKNYTEYDASPPPGGWTVPAVRGLLLHGAPTLHTAPSWPYHEGMSQLQKAWRLRSPRGILKSLAKIGWGAYARLRGR